MGECVLREGTGEYVSGGGMGEWACVGQGRVDWAHGDERPNSTSSLMKTKFLNRRASRCKRVLMLMLMLRAHAHAACS